MTTNNSMVVGFDSGGIVRDVSESFIRPPILGRTVTVQKQKEREKVVKHNRKLAKLAKKARKAQRKATMGMRK